MLVVEVYNKAEWEISGDDDDSEGRARKSKQMQQMGGRLELCSC